MSRRFGLALLAVVLVCLLAGCGNGTLRSAPADDGQSSSMSGPTTIEPATTSTTPTTSPDIAPSTSSPPAAVATSPPPAHVARPHIAVAVLTVEPSANSGPETSPLVVLDTSNGSIIRELLPEAAAVELGRDGSSVYAIAGAGVGNIVRISIEGGPPEVVVAAQARALALSPDGTRLAYIDHAGDSSCGAGDTMVVRELGDGTSRRWTVTASPIVHETNGMRTIFCRAATSLSFGPDNRMLAFVAEGRVHLLDTSSPPSEAMQSPAVPVPAGAEGIVAAVWAGDTGKLVVSRVCCGNPETLLYHPDRRSVLLLDPKQGTSTTLYAPADPRTAPAANPLAADRSGRYILTVPDNSFTASISELVNGKLVKLATGRDADW